MFNHLYYDVELSKTTYIYNVSIFKSLIS